MHVLILIVNFFHVVSRNVEINRPVEENPQIIVAPPGEA